MCYVCNFHKTTLWKQSPNRRKFAQSGHPESFVRKPFERVSSYGEIRDWLQTRQSDPPCASFAYLEGERWELRATMGNNYFAIEKRGFLRDALFVRPSLCLFVCLFALSVSLFVPLSLCNVYVSHQKKMLGTNWTTSIC
jgi:hypothetical protein